MTSLRLRLLALTSLLLAASFALLGGAIDRSFLAALEAAQRDLLDSQVITLLAVAEPEAGGTLGLPPDMPEQRLNTPGSGLYAVIRDRAGTPLWRSASALGIDLLAQLPQPDVGGRIFSRASTDTGDELQVLTLGVLWEFETGGNAYYALTVAESRASLDAQLANFRNQLYLAFLVIAVTLVIAVGALLSWLLRPLGRIEREIEAVEIGARDQLSADYPSELTGVARNLNGLLASEQQRVARYKDTLANLAHSLKTPLAAAQNLVAGREDARPLQQQLQRMQDIVRYQLARPAAAGGRLLGRGAVPVADELSALLDGLDKVYRDKQVSAEMAVAPGTVFHGDKGDLVEMLGNVLDNAYKWCQRRVAIDVQQLPARDRLRKPGLAVTVDDDGPGFGDGADDIVFARGGRLDEDVPGTGIGLAVVHDLVGVYGGSIAIERAPAGGARVRFEIPPH